MVPAKYMIENSGKIECHDGWIYYRPMAGNRYYVTANGHRAQTIGATELSGVLRELQRELGGRKVITAASTGISKTFADDDAIAEAFLGDEPPSAGEEWDEWERIMGLPVIKLQDGRYFYLDTSANRLYNDEDLDDVQEFKSAQELTDFLAKNEDKTWGNVGSKHQFTAPVYKEPEKITLDKKLAHEVFRYGDYAVLLMPNDEHFIRREGIDMQHCLAYAYHSYCERAKAKEIELYSLIDLKDGDPKVDIEVAMTISSYSGKVPYPIAFQIRGKRNQVPPSDEYIPALMAFFNSYGKEHGWKLSGHGFKNFDGRVDGDLLVRRASELPGS